MANATSTIPRFLLPQNGQIWRRARIPHGAAGAAGKRRGGTIMTTTTTTGQLVHARFASEKAGSAKKPIVLEKPARFNPPSHGSRLPKRQTSRHYGGDLNAHEVRTQERTQYPGLMAPVGTWAHWIWHSRSLHLFITLGTLGGLATFSFVENFRRNSPFADMMPSALDFLYHPFGSVRTVVEIIQLSEAHNSAVVHEKRMRRVDDVAKRNEYRKAHGLDPAHGFWGTAAAAPKPDEEQQQQSAEGAGAVATDAGAAAVEVEAAPAQRKKWLGVF